MRLRSSSFIRKNAIAAISFYLFTSRSPKLIACSRGCIARDRDRHGCQFVLCFKHSFRIFLRIGIM
jgi:hypothetical protein